MEHGMDETLPDVMVDDRIHVLFLTGFSITLLTMVAVLAGIAIARHRARTAGIYHKYAVANDEPNHRRILSRNCR